MVMPPGGSESDQPAILTLNPRTIRSHRKSRNGCINCKRRKVKCDELPTGCGSCARFNLICNFTSPSPGEVLCTQSDGDCNTVARNEAAVTRLPRRGRGRPRRNWSTTERRIDAQVEATAPAQSGVRSETESQIEDSPRSGPACNTPLSAILSDPVNSPINLAQAELLYHFIFCTGPGLAGSEDFEHPLALFWARNTPQIGLQNRWILHLILSLSAYHLAHLTTDSEEVRSRWLTLAEVHGSLGLKGTNEALSSPNVSNCGTLYLSSILICYCTFAAGPTISADSRPHSNKDSIFDRRLAVGRAVRLLRERFSAEELFSGLMKPLGTSSGVPEDPRPTCICEGFVRLDWKRPIDRLQELIASQGGGEDSIFAKPFQTLALIYEGNFGDEDGCVGCPLNYKLVLIWLYMMEDDFVISLERRTPLALLLLAYFAPLLKTLKKAWFLQGWPEHIIVAVRGVIPDTYLDYLEWPEEAIHMLWNHLD